MPVYLLQQAERRTEYQEDIEKKKQELYAEIDSLPIQIKVKTPVNHVKKFLAAREVWNLTEMDYPLRTSYEQYLKKKLKSDKNVWYMSIYDIIKQQHIYQQMQTLSGKRFYEWKYQKKIFYLKYYPDQQIGYSLNGPATKKKSGILRKDLFGDPEEADFYTLTHIIAKTSGNIAYRNNRIKALKILYDSCVRQNIQDIGLLETEQIETIFKDFADTKNKR